MLLSSKKSYFDFFFFTYKLGWGRSISKVTQTLKNVNQDPQGCPTIPYDHSMCLHHPVGSYLCVLSTIIFPYKSRKSTKKSTSVTPTPEKTSDSAFSSKVRSTKVKLKIRNSKNWLGYSRMGLRLPSRRGFFSRTSKKVKNILKIPTKSAKSVHHNKGVYGERSETRSEKKKKRKKKKKKKKKKRKKTNIL